LPSLFGAIGFTHNPIHGASTMRFLLLAGFIILGFVFYLLRRHYRLAYGLIEVGIGIVVIFLTIFPQTSYLLLIEEPLFGWLLLKSAGVSAGIYVLVRGLDNVEQGLTKSWRTRWDRVFGQSSSA
jgi:hypothetical protein